MNPNRGNEGRSIVAYEDVIYDDVRRSKMGQHFEGHAAMLILVFIPITFATFLWIQKDDPSGLVDPLGQASRTEPAPLTDPTQIRQLARDISVKFIHIGKAGGSSVDAMLNELFQHYRPGGAIHVRQVLPDMLKPASAIILVIRDPLSRFESAYKWRKHMQNYNGDPFFERRIFECFPTLSELGAHCLDDTPCARLLRSELLPNQSAGHMGKGIQYYLQKVDLDAFEERLHVIQNEHLGDDFNRAVSDILNRKVNVTLPRINSVYKEKNDSIPERFRDNVREMLHENYVVYEQVKRKYIHSELGLTAPLRGPGCL